MTSGIIFDIKRFAINDGPGIRTAVFLKGCPLNCWWCHNPEGQSIKPQLMFRANRCKSTRACLDVCEQKAITWHGEPVTEWELCQQCGKCCEACFAGAREMIGREVTTDQLMAEIERDIPFYEQSGGGVTFTGGEPLLQIDFLALALRACKNQNIHTAVDTSGYTSWESLRSIIPLVDLFLYDIKLMDSREHLKYTSVSNKRILDNLLKLTAEDRPSIIARVPIIPGINDDEANLNQCGAFLASLKHAVEVEIMPYHEIGIAKYEGLGMKYKLDHTSTPTDEQIEQIEHLFSSYGLQIIKHTPGRKL